MSVAWAVAAAAGTPDCDGGGGGGGAAANRAGVRSGINRSGDRDGPNRRAGRDGGRGGRDGSLARPCGSAKSPWVPGIRDGEAAAADEAAVRSACCRDGTGPATRLRP